MSSAVAEPRAASAAHPGCLYCGGRDLDALYTGVRDRLGHVPGERTFLRCRACGSAVLDHPPKRTRPTSIGDTPLPRKKPNAAELSSKRSPASSKTRARGPTTGPAAATRRAASAAARSRYMAASRSGPTADAASSAASLCRSRSRIRPQSIRPPSAPMSYPPSDASACRSMNFASSPAVIPSPSASTASPGSRRSNWSALRKALAASGNRPHR